MDAIRCLKFPLVALFLLLGLATFAVAAEESVGEDPDMKAVQMQMDQMRRQMAEIRSATDPQERRRLMEAHMRQMHEAMGMMSRTMMPKMKSRMRSQSHAPGSSRQPREDENSQQHMSRIRLVWCARSMVSCSSMSSSAWSNSWASGIAARPIRWR